MCNCNRQRPHISSAHGRVRPASNINRLTFASKKDAQEYMRRLKPGLASGRVTRISGQAIGKRYAYRVTVRHY